MEQKTQGLEAAKPEQHKHNPHLVDEDIQRLKNISETHGKTLTTILIVVLVAVIGFRFYNLQKAKKSAAASAALTNAKSVQDFEAIVEKYKTLPSAPVIKLQLAKSYFDENNYDMAITTYNELKDSNANDLVGTAALLGIANCLESRGQLEDSLKQYESFISTQKDSFLIPQAIMGKARTMDLLGQTQEAKELIEEFIAANQDSDWIPPAEEVLKKLKNKLSK